MSVLEALLELVHQVSGTPYIRGGNSPAGTDCSGLASWTANVASGRPAFSGRFHTSDEESALLARGFQYGTAPNALVIGWNGRHTAVTLPDGTPVASGEPGGVRIGGGGAYQPQFNHHMFLPIDMDAPGGDEFAPADPFAPPPPVVLAGFEAPAPEAPAPEPPPMDLPPPPMDFPPPPGEFPPPGFDEAPAPEPAQPAEFIAGPLELPPPGEPPAEREPAEL